MDINMNYLGSVTPFSDMNREHDNGSVRLVMQHHASPVERWQMLTTVRRLAKSEKSFRTRFSLTFMIVLCVLNPDCKACYYEWVERKPQVFVSHPE